MFRILSSDWLKTKRTAYRTIFFLLPPSVALVSLWYLSVHQRTSAAQANAYTLFFDLWTILIPFLTGLLAGILSSQEEQAGNFNGLLGTSVSRISIFFGKLLFLVLTTATSLFLSDILFVAGLVSFLHISGLQAVVFLEGAILTLLGGLPLYVLHLWLSFTFGMGASISVGGAGLLIAAVCGLTSAGDHIWRFLPWAWPARLSQIPETFLVPSLSKSVAGNWTGILLTILLFVLSTGCAAIWFCRWEGRKSYE